MRNSRPFECRQKPKRTPSPTSGTKIIIFMKENKYAISDFLRGPRKRTEKNIPINIISFVFCWLAADCHLRSLLDEYCWSYLTMMYEACCLFVFFLSPIHLGGKMSIMWNRDTFGCSFLVGYTRMHLFKWPFTNKQTNSQSVARSFWIGKSQGLSKDAFFKCFNE